MDKEDKKMLWENLRLSKDNHKILKKMQRNALWGRSLRVIYWLFIIGGALGAYYYIQPFVEDAREVFVQMRTEAENVTDGVTKTTQTATGAIDAVLNFGKNFLGQ